MRATDTTSAARFASIDDRVETCPSWIQQAFAKLDEICHSAAPSVRTHEAARAEGRIYYCGSRGIKFCRVDPNAKRMGVWFRKEILDEVMQHPKWRENRPDGPWIYVDEQDSLAPVATLIRRSCKAALSISGDL